jgi:hypothetical protein
MVEHDDVNDHLEVPRHIFKSNLAHHEFHVLLVVASLMDAENRWRFDFDLLVKKARYASVEEVCSAITMLMNYGYLVEYGSFGLSMGPTWFGEVPEA